MREMLQSKILLGFMVCFIGCMYFMTPDVSGEENLLVEDSEKIIVSDYAYI